MSKKILQIIPTLVRGGAEKQLTTLVTRLPTDQFETHVALLTSDGPYLASLEEAGIPVHSIGKRWKLDIPAYFRLKRLIQDLQPDLVHTWIFAANSYGRLASLKCGIKKIVAGERCVDPWKRWHEFVIDRYLAKRTHGIVTNSSGIRDFYQSNGISAEQFTMIPNGIEIPNLNPVAEMRRALLEALELPPETKLVGSVGRLWKQKRMKDLVWAADLLKCIRDDVHFLVVGDGPERWRLERFRDQVEIGDRFHFLGERADAKELIACLDVFWLASDYEGQSNALMEAMAAGVPVVATDIPGNRDLVVQDETGFLVPLGDRAAFAQRTERILNDASLHMNLSKNAIARMREEFTVEKMVSKYVDYYNGLLVD
ncbi:MAG: glycosyltransferase [Pirellulaceae bacterium]|nr:glycosyltransferase [Pirellulaceae bacterium]